MTERAEIVKVIAERDAAYELIAVHIGEVEGSLQKTLLMIDLLEVVNLNHKLIAVILGQVQSDIKTVTEKARRLSR